MEYNERPDWDWARDGQDLRERNVIADPHEWTDMYLDVRNFDECPYLETYRNLYLSIEQITTHINWSPKKN